MSLRRVDAGPCRLFGKLELMNPAGSIKDRIGLSMIEGAERDGRLNPKGNPPPTIIEATVKQCPFHSATGHPIAFAHCSIVGSSM